MAGRALIFAMCGMAAAKKLERSFENLVVFGDSYTDEQTLQYFYDHQRQWPSPGTVLGPVNQTRATGGYIWPRLAADDIGANLFNFAIAGGVCSEDLVSMYYAPINGSYPGILDGALPAFEASLETEAYSELNADNTVFGLWVGTNDLGYRGFLTDEQKSGSTINDFIDCVWTVFDRLYAMGGRRFALLNQAPLEKAPQYDASIGVNSTLWPHHTKYNMTLYEQRLLQYTTTVNTAFASGVPFELLIEDRWPGSTFSIFDVHSLLLDVYESPEAYLEESFEVQRVYRRCEPTDPEDCEDAEGSPDGFMWHDELHTTERVNRYIAQEFIAAVGGLEGYGKTYRSKAQC